MAIARQTQAPGSGSSAPLYGGETWGAGWRAEVIRAYDQALGSRPDPAGELATAVRRLTGRALAPDAIIVDAANGAAFGIIDGARLRWSEGRLALIRPCDHCGCGAFASPPLHSAEELGFALSAWQALHRDCQPFVADETD